MKFRIIGYYSIGIEDKIQAINYVSNSLEKFLSAKNYGEDLNELLIGVICVAPEFDKFNVPRKPKFTDFKEGIVSGIKVIEQKSFTYEIKIDYEQFYDSSENERVIFIIEQILDSLENLDKIPKKVKNFDKEKFKNDVKEYLSQLN